MSKPALLALLLAALSSAPVSSALAAQPAAPYLIRDLNQAVPENTGSIPRPFGTAGGRALFITRSGQLWASDGTAGGTRLIRDVAPLAGQSKDGNLGVQALKVAGERLFFLEESAPHSYRLWATDGTAEGTVQLGIGLRLRDPKNYPGDSSWIEPLQLLFFTANDAAHGTEPWVTDGTPAGTHLLRDMRPGPESSGPNNYASIGSRVVFQAFTKPGGPYLWRTDGTDAGTSAVPGSEKLGGFDFVSIGRKAAFIAFTFKGSTVSMSVWTTDGTSRGTAQLAKVSDIGEDWDLRFLGVNPGRLYFYSDEGRAGYRLWTSDGTAQGTRVLGRFPRPPYPYGEPQGLRFLPDGSALFFVNDGVHGMEWWRSDATVAGTRLLKDVCPGSCSSTGYPTALPVLVGKKLFVHLYSPQGGGEPWMSDGTAAGTRQIADTCPGPCSFSSYYSASRTAVGDLEIFWARPDYGDLATLDLWRTDGTSSGTFQLTRSRNPAQFLFLPSITLGDQLLFCDDDGIHGMELWATDGTIAGTRLVADLEGAEQAGSAPSQITALGDRAFFVADDGVHGQGLWVTNGTSGGTSQVYTPTVPWPSPYSSPFSNLAAGNGRLLFTFREGSASPRLWSSDGTAQGTYSIGDAVLSSPLTPLMSLGSRFLFPAADGLWATDGTSGGTARVSTRVAVSPSYYGTVRRFAALGDQLLFAGHGPEGTGLWKTDGTDAGTALVKELSIQDSGWTALGENVYFTAWGPGGYGLHVSDGTAAGTRRLDIPVAVSSFTAAGGRLFLVENLGYKAALWATDGTAVGTRKLIEVETGLSAPPLEYLKAVGNGVFFVADDGLHGLELWRSNGTAAGTFMVQDINPGPAGSVPHGFIVAGGVLDFSAYDGQHGTELWRSDGTRAGTVRLTEIAPGARSANPQELMLAGPRLFFSADDGSRGAELWALCLASPCSSSVP
jgi:ELWxxDGT repeat protein